MERYVAIDNVCAWPNLTVLPDVTLAVTIHARSLWTDWHNYFSGLGHQLVQLYLQETLMAESRSGTSLDRLTTARRHALGHLNH